MHSPCSTVPGTEYRELINKSIEYFSPTNELQPFKKISSLWEAVVEPGIFSSNKIQENKCILGETTKKHWINTLVQ